MLKFCKLWFFSGVFVHLTYEAMLFYVLVVGEAHSLKVEKVLFKDKSDFQEVLVFEVSNSISVFSFYSSYHLLNLSASS